LAQTPLSPYDDPAVGGRNGVVAFEITDDIRAGTLLLGANPDVGTKIDDEKSSFAHLRVERAGQVRRP
jgi:hypothetical protein